MFLLIRFENFFDKEHNFHKISTKMSMFSEDFLPNAFQKCYIVKENIGHVENSFFIKTYLFYREIRHKFFKLNAKEQRKLSQRKFTEQET